MDNVARQKPNIAFFQIFNMALGFFGLQIGFALQNANASRIAQSLGADYDKLALFWLAGPVTGLILQPIVGYMSDRTWGRLGRRRPFFLIGALMAGCALIFMPNSPYLWIAGFRGGRTVCKMGLRCRGRPFNSVSLMDCAVIKRIFP